MLFCPQHDGSHLDFVTLIPRSSRPRRDRSPRTPRNERHKRRSPSVLGRHRSPQFARMAHEQAPRRTSVPSATSVPAAMIDPVPMRALLSRIEPMPYQHSRFDRASVQNHAMAHRHAVSDRSTDIGLSSRARPTRPACCCARRCESSARRRESPRPARCSLLANRDVANHHRRGIDVSRSGNLRPASSIAADHPFTWLSPGFTLRSLGLCPTRALVANARE